MCTWVCRGRPLTCTYDVDEMCKDSCGLWVSQWARRIFWLITRQETLIQKSIIAPDANLTRVLEVYTANDLKLLASHQRVLSITVFSIGHLFIRLHVPIIIVLVLDRGLVEDLRWADIVAASEASEKEPWRFWLRLDNGGSLLWVWCQGLAKVLKEAQRPRMSLVNVRRRVADTVLERCLDEGALRTSNDSHWGI